MTTPNTSAAAVFDARQETAAAEAQYQPFPFVGLDGEEYTLPHPLMLPAAQQRALQDIDRDPNRSHEEFLEEFYPDQWAAIGEMVPAVQMALLKAWNDRMADIADDQAEETDPGK